ncbi:MAG: hypothetical protein ACI82F_004173 [Planctomycetota bacterium]|jgi:hypothetical protein
MNLNSPVLETSMLLSRRLLPILCLVCAGASSAQSSGTSANTLPGIGFPMADAVAQATPGDPGTALTQGSLEVWRPLTVTYAGPTHSELDDAPNPFLDYRLTAGLLSPSGQVHLLPGFFDGDGQGGSSGDKWSFRFSPDEAGTWYWLVSFRQGTDLAVDTVSSSGTPTAFDGSLGSVFIAPRDANAEGFYKWGLLEHTGEHYRKFRDGPYFLKTGVSGPENFFGYRGFDNTVNQPGGADTSGLPSNLHEYPSHVADWNSGDPLFTSNLGYDSRGIIGALNYLSNGGINSIFILVNNLGGDGRDTYPYIGASGSDFDLQHFDLSKLSQWGQVFEHAMSKGLMVELGLGEGQVENRTLLDNGTLGTNRTLFYREMVARFGHLLALEWNLCQDNTYSTLDLADFAEFIQSQDPHDHGVTFQSQLLGANGDYPEYSASLGSPLISSASLFHFRDDTGTVIERWRDDSANAGHKWAVDSAVQWPVNEGLSQTSADDIREEVLWDSLFSGGGLEFYMGVHALPEGGYVRLEDFRTRDDMWGYVQHARKLMGLMPFWQMEPADELLTGESTVKGGAEVLRIPGQLYALYYPDTTTPGQIDLTETNGGTFAALWYNPRTGFFEGSATVLTGGSVISVQPPPDSMGGSVFQEQNGLVVMQVESVAVVPSWVLETNVSGYTGSGYYRWSGPDMYNTPGSGFTRYKFNITTPGTYMLSIHNYHDDPEPDKDNDCWVNTDGGNFKKVYSNNGTATVGRWNWASDFESTGDQAEFFFGAGAHNIGISGRSNGYHMDRVHLWLSSVNDPLNLSLPESPRPGTGSPEDWVLVLVRIG